MKFNAQPFDYSKPPPSHDENRARRAAAMVQRIDEAWRWAGRKPLGADAAEIALELRSWDDSAWTNLARTSGANVGYVPHVDTRNAVVSCYESRAAAWQCSCARENSQKMIEFPPEKVGGAR